MTPAFDVEVYAIVAGKAVPDVGKGCFSAVADNTFSFRVEPHAGCNFPIMLNYEVA